MIKTDLNDFAWFVHVVEEGGFAAAGRALDEPKSKLVEAYCATGGTAGRAIDSANYPAV